MILRGVLARLQANLGGDSAIMAELIEIFLTDTPLQLAAMRQALVDGDAAIVQRVAHTLKSTSASLGAQALMSLCDTLEQQAHNGRLDGANAYLAQIEAAFAQVGPLLLETQAESAL